MNDVSGTASGSPAQGREWVTEFPSLQAKFTNEQSFVNGLATAWRCTPRRSLGGLRRVCNVLGSRAFQNLLRTINFFRSIAMYGKQDSSFVIRPSYLLASYSGIPMPTSAPARLPTAPPTPTPP